MSKKTVESDTAGRRVEQLVGRIRSALCDPDAQWYGSDLVPMVGDLCDWCDEQAKRANPGDPLSIFTWLDEARFVPDEHGGHIEFAGKTFHVAVQ